MPRYCLLTVDVEPDDVWNDFRSRSFNNLSGLLAMQNQCDRYGIRPTYLVTYSVAADPGYRSALQRLASDGRCEIGAHPHLWEIPPWHPLDDGPSMGTDYPAAVRAEKLANLVNLLNQNFSPVRCHRAGRWGFEAAHANALARLGLRADSSITPGMDWSSSGGPNFRQADTAPSMIAGVIEMPCTIRPARLRREGLDSRPVVAGVLRRLNLGPQWLRSRPGISPSHLRRLSDWGLETFGVANLMTHSSELIPKGSPYWSTPQAVARHFASHEVLFQAWHRQGVRSITLGECFDLRSDLVRAQG